MKSFIEKLGGRKFLLSLLVFVVCSLLVYFTKLDQESYFTLVKYLTLTFLGGNIAQTALVKKTTDKKVEFVEEMVQIVTEGKSLDQMGGRKFLFVIGVYLVATLLLLVKVIEAGIYIDIANWIVFVFVGANVGQKAVEQGLTISVNKTE